WARPSRYCCSRPCWCRCHRPPERRLSGRRGGISRLAIATLGYALGAFQLHVLVASTPFTTQQVVTCNNFQRKRDRDSNTGSNPVGIQPRDGSSRAKRILREERPQIHTPRRNVSKTLRIAWDGAGREFDMCQRRGSQFK